MRRGISIPALLSAILPMVTACSFGLTDVPDPSTVVDPDLVRTQAGAIGLYNEALTKFHRIYGGANYSMESNSFILATGFASDEMTGPRYAAFSLRRVGPDGLATPNSNIGAAQPYSEMHATRMLIDQTVGALKEYAKTAPTSYVAQMYAARGYIFVMFGELFCSGVPFSRAVYGGDLVIGRPATTTEMFEQAVANFDSALAVTTDSARVRSLAYVGKARALLNLKQFDAAAAVVSEANVPSAFAYLMSYNAQTFPNFAYSGSSTDFWVNVDFQMANRLGQNGLDYLDASGAGDPRLKTYMSGGFTPAPFPAKYPNGSAQVALADGIEARLIQAEARLNARDFRGWADILNALRQNTLATPIPALSDDSTVNAPKAMQENVMFRERAFWLYGTGHRLGDMRRLIRQYGRPLEQVFPIGLNTHYVAPNNVFSSYSNFQPPIAEIENNPYYTGCLNRDA